MTEGQSFHPADDQRDQALEVEVLIGRILDGEARPGDLDRFGREQANWRDLAERMADHARLQAAVERDLVRAEQVSLPGMRAAGFGRFVGPAVSIVGWAAAIALAFIIATGDVEPPEPQGYPAIDLAQISPHLDRVLEKHELDPLSIRTEQLPDGRWRITWLRRIVEIIESDEFDTNWIQHDQPALPGGF